MIAEIKRRSPSAGEIATGADAPDRAAGYRAAGANALSVLTDEKYFGGTLEDLARGHDLVSATTPPAMPCLRKDFMVHPVQVLQARQAGASAILIIVRALTDEEIEALQAAARAAGIDALFEIHNEADLARAVRHRAKIIGVNNRDLATFKTDLALSERLLPISRARDRGQRKRHPHRGGCAARPRAGAHAVLVGEALMGPPHPRP